LTVADILAGLIGDGDGDGGAARTENDASHPAAASGMRITFNGGGLSWIHGNSPLCALKPPKRR
jgi:hypothetical protein